MITHQKFRSAEDVGDLFRAGEQPIGAAYMASPSGHEAEELVTVPKVSVVLHDHPSTGSEGARMYFTVFELGVLPRALLVRVDGRARTGLGGLRRFSAQLAIAAVAAGVMLLTAAIGGTQ